MTQCESVCVRKLLTSTTSTSEKRVVFRKGKGLHANMLASRERNKCDEK